jgi:hypothetical protein
MSGPWNDGEMMVSGGKPTELGENPGQVPGFAAYQRVISFIMTKKYRTCIWKKKLLSCNFFCSYAKDARGRQLKKLLKESMHVNSKKIPRNLTLKMFVKKLSERNGLLFIKLQQHQTCCSRFCNIA